MRKGGSYTRTKPTAAPKRTGGTQDHEAGNMARDATGQALRRATIADPAETPAGKPGAEPAVAQAPAPAAGPVESKAASSAGKKE